jgi:hypothetical protein
MNYKFTKSLVQSLRSKVEQSSYGFNLFQKWHKGYIFWGGEEESAYAHFTVKHSVRCFAVTRIASGVTN